MLKQSIKQWARHVPMARWLKNVIVGAPACAAPFPHRPPAPATGWPRYRAEAAFDRKRYWAAVEENYRPLANPFSYYTFLVEELQRQGDVTLLPLCELEGATEPNRRIVGLRHDIDADPITGVRAARWLARHGIPGSFYLLHTAFYYGQTVGDRFLRHPELEEWVVSFIAAGCELGLHNDALGVCTMHGRDGAQAVLEEIAWLRQFGATIRGTVAHDSGPVHGAENYEVFKERLHWRRRVRISGGLALPLGALSEKELGLTYEGTFSRTKTVIDHPAASEYLADLKSADVSSESWMKKHLRDSPYRDFTLDFQFWLVGADKWIFSGRHAGREFFRHAMTLHELFEVFHALPRGTKTLFVLHPEYFRH